MLEIDVMSQTGVVDDSVQVELTERVFGDGRIQACRPETIIPSSYSHMRSVRESCCIVYFRTASPPVTVLMALKKARACNFLGGRCW